jgi:hypothetical protein
MKKILTLGTMLLGGCLAVAAQTGSTPNQTPPTSTPPTFPQDQTGQIPSNPTTPSDPSAIPPDTSASGQMSRDHATDQAANSQTTTVSGCLSQSPDGKFILADDSGNSFQLRGNTSQLSSFLGKQVKVDGIATTNSGSAGAMSSSTSSTTPSGSSTQFSVSDVHKVADSCASSTPTMVK